MQEVYVKFRVSRFAFRVSRFAFRVSPTLCTLTGNSTSTLTEAGL